MRPGARRQEMKSQAIEAGPGGNRKNGSDRHTPDVGGYRNYALPRTDGCQLLPRFTGPAPDMGPRPLGLQRTAPESLALNAKPHILLWKRGRFSTARRPSTSFFGTRIFPIEQSGFPRFSTKYASRVPSAGCGSCGPGPPEREFNECRPDPAGRGQRPVPLPIKRPVLLSQPGASRKNSKSLPTQAEADQRTSPSALILPASPRGPGCWRSRKTQSKARRPDTTQRGNFRLRSSPNGTAPSSALAIAGAPLARQAR